MADQQNADVEAFTFMPNLSSSSDTSSSTSGALPPKASPGGNDPAGGRVMVHTLPGSTGPAAPAQPMPRGPVTGLQRGASGMTVPDYASQPRTPDLRQNSLERATNVRRTPALSAVGQ